MIGVTLKVFIFLNAFLFALVFDVKFSPRNF